MDTWVKKFEELRIGETWDWESMGFSLTRPKSDCFELFLFITDGVLIEEIFGQEHSWKVMNSFPNCLKFSSAKNAAEFLVLNIFPICKGVGEDGSMILE